MIVVLDEMQSFDRIYVKSPDHGELKTQRHQSPREHERCSCFVRFNMCSEPMPVYASVKSSQSFLQKVRTSRTSPGQVEIGLLCIIDISFYRGKDATYLL